MEELAAVVNCTHTPQPILPDIRATEMNLRLKGNICYIVAGVVIQDGKVLLIQEAKPSCRGKWYLPAGRMEKDESIVEAVKREVLEESGFEFEPEALIAVESQGYFWFRFTFTGRITGGSLKTPDQADKESIQAGWFTADPKQLPKETHIRANDILQLIDLASSWFESRPFVGLPVAVGHISSSQRLVLVHDDGQELRVLLVKEGGTTRLPVCLLSGGRFENPVDVAFKECGYHSRYKQYGVLSMEHLGKPHGQYDGFCATFVFKADSLELKKKPKGKEPGFEWVIVTGSIVERLRTAMTSGGCATFMQL